MTKLRDIYVRRKGDTTFKERDIAYRVFENYYNARDPKRPGIPQITYRPHLIDDITTSTEDNHRYTVNLHRGVVAYFASTFAKIPRTWKTPLGGDEKLAGEHTRWLRSVFKNSHMGSLQPRNSHWLSLRGDCVYGVDWDEKDKRVLIRTYDPAWCYPQFSAIDLGAVENMLIAIEVPAHWAEEKYGVKTPGRETTHLFIYWDDQIMRVDVGETQVESQYREHKLGFCPFRWVFASGDGMLAQADVRDLASLQDLFNENLLLAIDSIRKDVDKAFWGSGLKGNLQPIAGTVLGLPNDNAKIQEFPTGGDPQVIMAVMNMLGQTVTQVGGMSPISASGQARGSIVTGTAVRNQVEASEARLETRRQVLEDTFIELGSYCFRVLETIFPKVEMTYPGKDGMEQIKGSDVQGWYECGAQYGDILGLAPRERMMVALQGLGHIYDDKMAIRLADLPDAEPEDMVSRIDDYQQRQAITAGRAQGLGQVAAQSVQQKPPPEASGEPPGPPQSAVPQPPSQPPQPGVAGMNVTLHDIEQALLMVKPQLRGPVFAVGDLAVVGMSAHPMVEVGVQRDLALVAPILAGMHGIAVPQAPPGMPRLEVA